MTTVLRRTHLDFYPEPSPLRPRGKRRAQPAARPVARKPSFRRSEVAKFRAEAPITNSGNAASLAPANAEELSAMLWQRLAIPGGIGMLWLWLIVANWHTVEIIFHT